MTDKIKTIIVDDEPLARQLITSYLRKHQQIEVVAECIDGFQGLKAIREQKPQLVFLDIQMPRLTGFEMLEVLEHDPVIIFSTAYDEFALKAFEANATDYLLKPYSQERFDAAITKAVEKIGNNATQSSNLQNLQSLVDTSPQPLGRLVLKSGSGIDVIAVQNIDYFLSADDYTEIFSGEKKYLKQKPLKFYDEHLDPGQFVRIHRTAILNIGRISRLEPYGKESWLAILKDGAKLPVSKTGYQNLKKILTL